jgi:hypothetical protein
MIFCSPKYPDRLWNPPTLLFSVHQCSFLLIKRQDTKLIIYLHLALSFRMSRTVFILLFAFVVWTGTILPLPLLLCTDTILGAAALAAG